MLKLGFYLIFALVGLCIFTCNCFKLDEYDKLIHEIARDSKYVHDFESNVQELLKIEPNYFDYTPFRSPNYTFECSLHEHNEPASSVHRLRPSDIKVVAALGDSLTAALGSNANTIFGLLLEYRGRSWSVGGQKDLEKLVTLPNILKKFNPDIKGFSTVVDLSLTTKEGVGFNVAVSGQEANHIPDQAQRLIQRMKESTEIDFQNDWKLITLFIGGNDLCDFCKDKNLHSPETYIDDIRRALDLFYKEVPKAFVNLVSVLKVSDVKKLNRGLVCGLLHKFECPCAAYPSSEEEEKELKYFFEQYSNYTENLVSSGRYEQRDDFTVVVQPFFKNFGVQYLPNGKIDYSYFAPDCFHFSTKGHATAAIGLWNNMLEPVGQKATTWVPGTPIKCPTKQHPYLFTNKNSIY